MTGDRLIDPQWAEWAACGILTLWFVLTVAAYFPSRWVRTVLRFDLLQLVQPWTFFAPSPHIEDGHVWFRAVDDSGVATPWRPLAFLTGRHWRMACWHPGRRSSAAFVRTQRHVWQLCADGVDRRSLEVSLPYLRLLGVVMEAVRRERGAAAEYCQFLLSRPPSGDEPDWERLVVRSGLHRVD